MANTKVLIVEDERLAASAIAALLRSVASVTVVGIARDGRSAVSAIRQLVPDIVFLDVELPELSGLEVVREIGASQMPITVFVTAYDRYTLDAFEAHALDYLLKPYEKERFYAALQRAQRQLHMERAAQHDSLTQFLSRQTESDARIVLKSGGRRVFVNLSEIDYVEAAGNYVSVHSGTQTYLNRETMYALEQRLPAEQFVRIHRSVIVNRTRVKELRPWYTGEYIVVLTSGKELTLSRGYRDKLPQLAAV